jgi:hypothetical protein
VRYGSAEWKPFLFELLRYRVESLLGDAHSHARSRGSGVVGLNPGKVQPDDIVSSQNIGLSWGPIRIGPACFKLETQDVEIKIFVEIKIADRNGDMVNGLYARLERSHRNLPKER